MKGTTTRADSTLNWTHHDSDLPDFCFSTIQPEDVEQVSEFLLKHFFAEEPLGQTLNLDPDKEVRPWLSKMVEHEVREGISVIVRLRSAGELGEIVAVCLNDVERLESEPDDVNIFTFIDKESQPSMWKITRVLDSLLADQDLFHRYQVDALVTCQMLCVGPRFAGRGLARKLIHLTEDLTKMTGFSLIVSEATSEFSSRAFLKAGFRCEKILQYANFTLDGQQPFQQLSNSVHSAAQLMIKQLK